jgi:hypothetical protein
MVRTQEALEDLVNYEAVSGISLLQPPSIEKADISDYILCQNFQKSMERGERTMERFNEKVNELQDRLAQSEDDIKSLEKTFRKVNPGDPPSRPGSFLGPSETPENIASYNREVREYDDRLQQARRLQERISDATDRHRDIVERHNDAVREAEEKLEELAAEALRAIDEDIVSVLHNATLVTVDLAKSENDDDLMAAVEICFIEFRIFNAFAGYIEGNTQLRTSEEIIQRVFSLLAILCESEEVLNSFVNLFRQNSTPIDKNAELYAQVVEIIDGVDQETLDEMTNSFSPILKREFYTDFKYEGIVDPAKLDSVVSEMHKTIDDLKNHITTVTEMDDSTRSIAEASVNVHQELESNLLSMKTNVEAIGDNLLTKEHFVCEIFNEEVIKDAYNQDLQTVVTDFRANLVEDIGEEQFEAIGNEETDRFSVEKTEVAIKEANILRLQNQRDKVAGYVSKLSTQIKDIEADLESAAEVPKKNADGFRSSTSVFYILSCLPVFGFAFALSIRSKINRFASAFKSPLEIYHELGTAILVKNGTMQKVILVLGPVLGVGGMGLLFGARLGAKIATSMKISAMAVNLGLPCVVIVLYVITWVILSNAGKILQSYIGSSEATSEPTSDAESDE